MTTSYAQVNGVSSLAVVQEETPAELAPGTVRVSITFCGICATDTHNYTSGGQIPASVFGHEWTGVIAATADDVTGLPVGTRVIASVGAACGVCAQCQAGHPGHCDLAFAEANGVAPGSPTHGAFAQSLVVSQRRVMPVLDGLSDVEAALVEPTAVTFHAVRRTHQDLGAIVVVQGAGPIGLLTAQHARHAGAGQLIVIEPNEERRKAATDLGFTDVLAPGEAARNRVLEVSDGLGADVLYECTGVAALLQPSAELVRRGGTLSLLGFPMTDSTVSYGDWQIRELTVIGSLAYTRDDFLGAQRAIADGSVKVAGLHTGTIGLGELAAMLDELDSGRTAHAKVLLDPSL
ncbi:zinc-dependent alcohol dehydrogenase [Kineosporia succinea]|uniref:(R,R)-butanediol dehydrogenase/meso-butanediol dehydrogenase/diacetyl reductase n=1 Tax=Kineosporia succinea TaxID=84632 RepID=A0ABT9P8X3_9ACTN|nr:zinc-binding dehydrogenase [Kineosporia succinea]MDP9829153.1 (R,R)-butanediol dehydrogenase/meso-butanediol dehydrogenase/diacetyl reductase [Kineosporia succinea]